MNEWEALTASSVEVEDAGAEIPAVDGMPAADAAPVAGAVASETTATATATAIATATVTPEALAEPAAEAAPSAPSGTSSEAASSEAASSEAASSEAASSGANPNGALSWEGEAEALRAVYPAFDLAAEMAHPVMGAILRGEARPTLRQLYEAVHWESIAEARAAEAVAAAVRESEARLLEHIRARGQRPTENGTTAAAGIRMYPAVSRLTRRERAQLARRAECGEHIRF